MTITYNRQDKIFDPVRQKYKINIMGAGSLGSFTAFTLAKCGFNNIKVYDFDYVEKHNIANQLYRVSDIGVNKVDALKQIIQDFAEIEIETETTKVTEKTNLNPGLNEIFVLTFDTLEARKLFKTLVKDFDCIVIDARMGGEEYSIETFQLSDDIKKWEKSLDIIPTDLPCGEKSIIYTNVSVASEVCNIVKQINNDETYATKLIRTMKNYDILADKR